MMNSYTHNYGQYKPEHKQKLTQLYYIFTYYCSFGDRENYDCLKIQNFKRMLIDAQVIQQSESNTFNCVQLDLLYTKTLYNKNGIVFTDFVVMLKEISRIYCNEEGENALSTLVNGNFQALFEFIRDSTEFGKCIKFMAKSSLEEGSFTLLKTVSPTLFKIYLSYYDTKDLIPSNTASSLFKILTNLTKDFEITPQLITKTESFVIFSYLTGKIDVLNKSKTNQIQYSISAFAQWFSQDKNNNPFSFKYFHFLQYFILVSLVAGKKITGFVGTQVGGLASFLELLGVSKGFQRFCKTEQVNLHLIPNKKLVDSLNKTSKILSINTQNQSVSSGCQKLNQAIYLYQQQLRLTFNQLCLHGQSTGTNHLSHKKVQNIVLQLNIGLSKSKIQILLATLRQNKTHQTDKILNIIDFQTFIKFLNLIILKQSVQPIQLISKLLFIADQNKITQIPQFQMSKKQYHICILMIKRVSPWLEKIFKSYSFDKVNADKLFTLLQLHCYLKFLHNFDLTPIFLQRDTAISVFRNCVKNSCNYMTFQEFKNSLISVLSYIQVENPQKFPQKTMVILLQRMNQSRGAKKLSKLQASKEDALINFRPIFKQYYPQNEQKLQKLTNMREILNTIC